VVSDLRTLSRGGGTALRTAAALLAGQQSARSVTHIKRGQDARMEEKQLQHKLRCQQRQIEQRQTNELRQ
jgi:hypothetical protein